MPTRSSDDERSGTGDRGWPRAWPAWGRSTRSARPSLVGRSGDEQLPLLLTMVIDGGVFYEMLSVSMRTVDSHLTNVRRKLGGRAGHVRSGDACQASCRRSGPSSLTSPGPGRSRCTTSSSRADAAGKRRPRSCRSHQILMAAWDFGEGEAATVVP